MTTVCTEGRKKKDLVLCMDRWTDGWKDEHLDTSSYRYVILVFNSPPSYEILDPPLIIHIKYIDKNLRVLFFYLTAALQAT